MRNKSVTNSPADKHDKSSRSKAGGVGTKTQYGNVSVGANRRGGQGGYRK